MDRARVLNVRDDADAVLLELHDGPLELRNVRQQHAVAHRQGEALHFHLRAASLGAAAGFRSRADGSGEGGIQIGASGVVREGRGVRGLQWYSTERPARNENATRNKILKKKRNPKQQHPTQNITNQQLKSPEDPETLTAP